MTDKDFVIVGRFGRAHGIKGMISVISFTEPRENILGYQPWYISVGNQWKPLDVSRTEAQHKLLLASVTGYYEREQVAQLTNLDIAVDITLLPKLEEGEFYWHELIGMQVITLDSKVLGVVQEILPTGANDVLVVTGETRCLVPYVMGHTVQGIDRTKRIITVDWNTEF